MKIDLIAKFKAFTYHLLISSIIIGLIFAAFYWVWFPKDYLKAGAWGGLKIILLVDIVLGPLLTFVVYNKKKKRLWLDLSVIALIQFAGLAYGLHITYQERPVISLLGTDGAYIFSASEVDELEIPAKFKSHTGPQNYYFLEKNDADETIKNKLAYELIDGKKYEAQTQYYANLGDVKAAEIQERLGIIIKKLGKFSQRNTAQLNESQPANDCTWIPINAKHLDSAYTCYSIEHGAQKIEVVH